MLPQLYNQMAGISQALDPTLQAVISGVLTGIPSIVIDGTYTLGQSIRLMNSYGYGKTSVSGTTFTFRDLNDTKNRITATVSASQRQSITYDLT